MGNTAPNYNINSCLSVWSKILICYLFVRIFLCKNSICYMIEMHILVSAINGFLNIWCNQFLIKIYNTLRKNENTVDLRPYYYSWIIRKTRVEDFFLCSLIQNNNIKAPQVLCQDVVWTTMGTWGVGVLICLIYKK